MTPHPVGRDKSPNGGREGDTDTHFVGFSGQFDRQEERRSVMPLDNIDYYTYAINTDDNDMDGRARMILPAFSKLTNKNSFDLRCLADTGAKKSVMPLTVATKLNLKISPDIVGTVRGASGQDLKQCGVAQVFIKTGKSTRKMIKFLVCENMTSEILVGLADLINLGIVSQTFPKMPELIDEDDSDCLNVEMEKKTDMESPEANCMTAQEQEMVSKLKSKYRDVFVQTLKPDKTISKETPVEIKLRPGAKPYQILGARTTPVHFRAQGSKLTSELMQSGVIRRVTEAREWTAPANFVVKPGTDKLRLVTDFSKLNAFVVRPVTPFPSPADIMKRIQPGSKIFCSMAAKHGYFQLLMSEEASKLTTFILEDGRFEYLRAPQGLVSSGDHFNGVMQEILRGLGNWIHIELDDILITGKSLPDLEGRSRRFWTAAGNTGFNWERANSKLGTA